MAAERDGRRKIVIIGGGVVGCVTAYYLTRHPSYSPERHDITLLEATRIAGGASGKAGGLLARWAYPSSLVPLSFDLHEELAAEHDGARAWGYRNIHCGKLTARHRGLADAPGETTGALAWAAQQLSAWVPLAKRRNEGESLETSVDLPKDLDWFRSEGISKYEDIAPRGDTAQLNPYQFTTTMASLAEDKGARILVGAAVEEIEYGTGDSETADGDDPVASTPAASRMVRRVRYLEKATARSVHLPADIVILAAGPWAPDLLPTLPMTALRAHSITIKPPSRLSAYCLFTDIYLPLQSALSSPDGENFDPRPDVDEASATARLISPEIYSRPNGEVYVAGESDTRVPLPASTDDVEVDRRACGILEEAVGGVSDELRSGLVTARRACYLPTVDLPSGNPLVGRAWADGLLVATGHGCWGIHNSPATGKLISEMVFDGEAKSADISALDPRLVI